MPRRETSPGASSRATTRSAATSASGRTREFEIEASTVPSVGFTFATNRQLLSLSAAKPQTAPVGARFLLSVVLQLAMYAAAAWPRVAQWSKPDITILHFMLVPFVTDGLLLGMLPSHRHWGAWFRIATAAQIGALTVQLALYDFDRDVAHIAASLGTCALVVLDAVLTLWRTTDFSRFDESLFAFLKYWIRVVGPANAAHGFVTSAAFILLANVFANTHNMWGDSRIDGPLTQFQSGDAPTALLKMSIVVAFVPSKMHRFVVTAAFFGALAAQWPLMPQMFFGARWPVLHIGAELSLLAKTIAGAKRAFA